MRNKITITILILVITFALYFFTLNFLNKNIVMEECFNECYIIEKRQYNFYYGIAGHNFIVFKDPDGKVFREIHGFATNPTTGKIDGLGKDSTSRLSVWVYEDELGKINQGKYFNSYTWLHNKYIREDKKGISHLYKDEQNYATVFVGTKKTLDKITDEMFDCVEKINIKNIDYPYLGIFGKNIFKNSNSVAHTMLRCASLDSPYIGALTPGDWINLLD